MKLLDDYYEAYRKVLAYFGLTYLEGHLSDMSDARWYLTHWGSVCWTEDDDLTDNEEWDYSGSLTRQKPIKGDKHTLVCIHDDCGGSPRAMVFDNWKKIEAPDEE